MDTCTENKRQHKERDEKRVDIRFRSFNINHIIFFLIMSLLLLNCTNRVSSFHANVLLLSKGTNRNIVSSSSLLYRRQSIINKNKNTFLSQQKASSVVQKSTQTGTAETTPSSTSTSTTITLPNHVKICWDVNLPEGRCVGITMKEISDTHPDAITIENLEGRKKSKNENGDDDYKKNHHHWACSAFHENELQYGLYNSTEVTSKSFWIGRLAMRMALNFPTNVAILKDSYGRPVLTHDVCGSISHKNEYGVALVRQKKGNDDNDEALSSVGIDLEWTSRPPSKKSIGPRVLTPNELNCLGNIPGITAEEEVLLRFSLKEAIYKAAHPLLCQYVSFQEAEVTPHSDGTATCDWSLQSNADERISKLTAHWRKIDNGKFFLTSASAYSTT